MMRHIHSFLRFATVLATLSVAAIARPADAQTPSRPTDVTGKWLFSVTTSAGTGTPTITFAQKGDSLTGHYSSATLGESELAGTLKADKIAFSVKVEVQGTALTVVYTGTVERGDSMKGSVDLGGMATGTFTAKKQ
ncbi:MAG: hypothetical protein ABI625_01360 [bacterium]